MISSSTIELSDLMQVEESIVVVEVVSVSTDVGWVVIPYYYYDFKQTKATQILLLIAFESAVDKTRIGSDRIGSDRIGLTKPGSDRIGSDRIGLGKPGPDQKKSDLLIFPPKVVT